MPNMATSLGTHSYPYISILYLSSYVKRAGREKNKGHGVTAALSKSIMGNLLKREFTLHPHLEDVKESSPALPPSSLTPLERLQIPR